MSKPQQITKLEALLARIRSRASEPRGAAPAVVVATARVTSLKAPANVAPPRAAVITPVPTPVPTPEPSAPLLDDEVTVAVQMPMTAAAEPDSVVEVDLVEVAGDAVLGMAVDELMAPEALGSRERLVAADPLPLEATETAAVSERSPVRPVEEEPPPELLADETDVEEAGDIESTDIEEAVASSRRPVGPQPEEQLAELAFGAEEPQPPRHTPPPESGRLPAAPAAEFDPDVTGVHEASPIAQPRTRDDDLELAIAAAPSPLRELVPDATRATLPPGDGVADVVGQAQRFQPATFVALLEASLAL